MVSLQSQAHDVQHDDHDNVLRSFKEWMVQEAQADRNRKAFLGLNDTAGENSYISPNIASQEPPINPNQRAVIEEISDNKPSVGRRVFRTFVYSLIFAAMVAVAWQAYRDDEAKKMFSVLGHSWLTWVSSLSRHKSSVGSDPATARAPKSSDQTAAVAQSGAAPALADVSRELQQQLQAVISDLAIVRRAVEQIASKQEQMAQDIATLQAAERNVSQKVSSPAPPAQAAAVRPPRRKVPKMVRPAPVEQPPSVPPPVSPPPAETTRPPAEIPPPPAH